MGVSLTQYFLRAIEAGMIIGPESRLGGGSSRERVAYEPRSTKDPNPWVGSRTGWRYPSSQLKAYVPSHKQRQAERVVNPVNGRTKRAKRSK